MPAADQPEPGKSRVQQSQRDGLESIRILMLSDFAGPSFGPSRYTSAASRKQASASAARAGSFVRAVWIGSA
jgi:hypothetical protein